MPRQQLELFAGRLGGCITNQLDLVELVRSQNSARVLARGAGLATEAFAVRDKSHRNHLGIENLVTIEVRDRDFGRRDEKQLIAARCVRVILELRQLAGARHRRSIDEEWWPYLLVAVFV